MRKGGSGDGWMQICQARFHQNRRNSIWSAVLHGCRRRRAVLPVSVPFFGNFCAKVLTMKRAFDIIYCVAL